MLLDEEEASEFRLVRVDKEASSAVMAEGKAVELIIELSFTDRNPFKTDRRGFGKLRGQERLVAGDPAMAEGMGLAIPCGVGVKDKGRPVKADDNELELLAEAVTDAAGKGRLAKGAEADAKASLGAGVAHCVESP